MEISKLILEYIKALAWPTVVVFAIFFFRDAIKGLFNRISKAKLPGGTVIDLEADFREVLDEAPSPKTSKLSEPKFEQAEFLGDVLAIAEVSPNAAIPFAWQNLERVFLETLSGLQGFSDKSAGYRIAQNVEMLREEGVLTDEETKLLHDLRRLRNEVSHNMVDADSITFKTARDYAIQCLQFSERMTVIKGETQR